MATQLMALPKAERRDSFFQTDLSYGNIIWSELIDPFIMNACRQKLEEEVLPQLRKYKREL